MIERFIEAQASLRSYESAPRPPRPRPPKMVDRRHTGRLIKRDNLLTGKGGGGRAWNCKKACYSINHSILFAWGLLFVNIERNPDRALRNANDYFIPQHRIELVKKLLLYTFPAAWNNETDEKVRKRT
jgi:hypothetical protein